MTLSVSVWCPPNPDFPVGRLPSRKPQTWSACSHVLPVLLWGDTGGHGPFPGRGGKLLPSPATPATPPTLARGTPSSCQ